MKKRFTFVLCLLVLAFAATAAMSAIAAETPNRRTWSSRSSGNASTLVEYVAGHEHIFFYTVTDNVMTAVCTADDCTEPPFSVSVAVQAISKEEDGLPATVILEGQDAFEEATGIDLNAALHFIGKDYDSDTAPTEVGTYTVTLTVDKAALSVPFEISVHSESAPAMLSGIDVVTQPEKTVYAVGEVFDPAGMVVAATYSDNTVKNVAGYTLRPSAELTAADNFIEIGYTEDGVTKYTTLSIEVLPSGDRYRIIIGAEQYVPITAASATFASNADFAKFDHVEVDGKTVAKKYYHAESGSTVITFNRDFIKTLKVGMHNLTIVSTDGSASATFTVIEHLPQTGDHLHPAMLLMLLAVNGAAILLVWVKARKRD